jgi:hypothetical protein
MKTAFSRLARLTASAGLLGAVTVSSPIQANAPDADATRITSAGHSLAWNWTPPGRSDRFGHGETLIHAPLAAVRHVVLDFSHYKELPPYAVKTSRVVGHGADGSIDVYLQIAVMNEMVMLWDVTRFAPLRRGPEGNEIVEGNMVPGKGNVDDAAAVWTLHSAAPDWTVLKFDILLRPGLPAPQNKVDEELRNSAVNVVDSIRDRLQGTKGVEHFSG